ncbi:MAG: biotin--[acetyl-CoA-carboxylase] ligase [Dysgonamonadaceae bacterium]|jgi:BirA family biotin operon repressor/biotin-[acetyl-CoA-carboxylase] ligase|nr:biotin--[acetyl-CoA-carboxylase] ligase [Dysgonamonadaceae bacterium]
MNRITKIKETDSTNRQLKAQSEKQRLDEGAVLAAEFQTAGKGQRGNRWESEAGKNITCSILLYPRFLPVKQRFLLSETVALGLKDALEQYLQPLEIKWANDIFHQNRKLAGILIENELTGEKIDKSIIGIGLNVNQEKFSDNAPNAVSIKQIIGREIDVDFLTEQTVNAILFRYNLLKSGYFDLIRADYHGALYRKSGFYRFADKTGVFTAEIKRVADDGLLHLATDAGENRAYAFKEVSFE